MSIALLLLLALVPGLALALIIYLRDRHAPEPYSLLLLSCIYGVLSYFITMGLGFLFHNFIYINDEDVLSQLVRAFVFVGLLGEGIKFLFLRGIIYYYKDFNQPFDGIVYAVMVGIGFATTENILYVINGDGDTALVRIITAVPAHAVFAVIMGFFLGEAKLFKNRAFVYSAAALLFAAFAHGYYDYFLYVSYIRGLWMQAAVSIIIVLVLTYFAVRLRKNAIIN